MKTKILIGDCIEQMRTLPDESVHCCITSPPYFGLRDYGTGTWEGGDINCVHICGGQVQDNKAPGAIQAGVRPGCNASVCKKCGAVRIDKQIGLESTPDEYVQKMVEVFREVRRVLRDDATLWLNLGDSYAAHGARTNNNGEGQSTMGWPGQRQETLNKAAKIKLPPIDHGLKPKDLIGIPWRVAFALQQPYNVPCCVKSEIDRAWLAAMFDGDGSIGIRRFSSYRKEKQQIYQDGFVAYTSVTNSDVELLDRCIDITGIGNRRIKWGGQAGEIDKRGVITRRDSYGWRQDGNNAIEIIRAIYPYLIAKRKQATIAYTLDCLNKNSRSERGNGPVPKESQEKRALLYDLIKKCNQRQPVDLPSWIEEPKQKTEPGWYLRQDIIWAKPNPLQESVKDRCTKAHEYVFLLSKSARYYYDAEAIKEGNAGKLPYGDKLNFKMNEPGGQGKHGKTSLFSGGTKEEYIEKYYLNGRNKRSVWTIATTPFKGAHFATFPPKLIEPMVLAGCPKGGTILDPFGGSGTTAYVANGYGRKAILCELNPEYEPLIRERLGMPYEVKQEEPQHEQMELFNA